MRTAPAALVPALAAALLLAGCGGYRGLESANQPVVHRTTVALDVRTAGDRLAFGEADRLGQWFATLNLGYGDHVTVDAGGAAAPSLRDDVALVAGNYGVLMDDAAAPTTPGGVPDGSARVIVVRADATVPGCPNFGRPAQPNFDASQSSNFGCATNVNLAMMVADPADLIHGRNAPITDPKMAAKAVKAFRDATPTGAGSALKTESSKGN